MPETRRRKPRAERYPYRVTHQTANGRQDEFFETRETFVEFLTANLRWVTSISVPEHDTERYV